MDAKSDILNHERGLLKPLDRLLNDRSLKAADFLARVNGDGENYQSAAESLDIDLDAMTRKLAMLVSKAKAKKAKKD